MNVVSNERGLKRMVSNERGLKRMVSNEWSQMTWSQ